MTVVIENPILEVNGNGTKTGYSFSFSYTDPTQIDILYTPDGGAPRQLASAEYKIIPNTPPFSGASVEFITITPQNSDVLRFTRTTSISQDVDFIGTGTVAPVDVELDFDKIVRILQELYANWQDTQNLIGKIPSPLFQAFGKFIVSNGIDGWDFFPLRLDNPNASDDAKILIVDMANKRIKYQSAPSIANPVLPQPVPGTTFKLIGIKDGSYQIGDEIPTFGASDGGKIAMWNGTRYIGVLGTGVANPTIPLPSSEGLVLTSKADTTTEWIDDGFKRIALSSGVVSGLKITQVNSTTINIDAGILEVVENTIADPTVKIVNFQGATNVSIPTSVGLSHYIYINASTATPVVVTQSTYESLPRGSKIYIGEVLHRNNNQITAIHQNYTIVAAIPSQLREVVTSFLGAKIVKTTLTPYATTAVSPQNLQMRFAGGGIFIGYGVNAHNDPLNPHVLTGVPANTPCPFRWRNALEVDTALQTTLSTTAPLIDNGAGVLSVVPNNQFVQVLVWVSPMGELVLQYPRTSYQQANAIPAVSEFLTKVEKSPAALKYLAPFAVLQMKQGTTFQDTANTFITPISGFSATGIAGAQGDRLPFASTSDAGKPLVVSSTSNWIVGNYSLPSIPAGAPAGKTLVTNGTTTSLTLDYPVDHIARTWLSNGVLSGFQASFTTGSTINISAGRALFCNSPSPGEVPSVTIVSYAGGTFTLSSIGARTLSYIYLNLNGTITDSGSLLDSSRGNILRLFRVEHFDNVNIADVKPIYNALSVVPNQIRHIYDFIGRTIRNFEVTVKTNTSLRISSAIFYGFDAGAPLNILEPHSIQMPARDPITFKFIKRDGTGITSSVTDFPLAPSVELTPSVLTTLPVGNVGYYAMWVYQDGKTYVEYAQQQYPAASAPNAADYFLTYKRNTTLEKIAVLIGFIKWENGKDYSSGNSFIPINAPVSSGSGSLPLIQTTTSDAGRLVTVSETGAIGLGISMPQPKSDGSDSSNFSDKVPVYDSSGTFLQLRDFGDVPNLDSGSKHLAGAYFVAIKNGQLYALTNKTDFTSPTLHSFGGLEYYPVEPIYVHTTRKGLLISSFTRNDGGGGLTAATPAPIRIADLATNKRGVWGATPPANPVGFGEVRRNPTGDYCKWLPQNATNAARYNAAQNEYVVQDTVVIEATPTPAAGGISPPYVIFLSGAFTQPTLDILAVTPYEYTVNLATNVSVGNAPRYLFSYISVDPVFENVGFYRFFASINLPTGRAVSGKIIIKKVEITARTPLQDRYAGGTNPYDPQIGLSFFVTSSTALSQSDVLLDMNTGNVAGAVTTYDVNKEFTFDSSSASFFHDFTNTPDTNKNIVFGACPRIVRASGTYNTGLAQCYVTFGIELNEIVNTTRYSRYEYTTLAAIDALSAVPSKIWAGESRQLSVDPVTGMYKITLIYAILYPLNLKTSAEYNKDYEGIFVHPLKPEDTPQVFLEDQSGTTKYTQRVQCNKRNVRSTIFEVYDIECTPEQFNNWRLAIYFTNKILEATFKTYCDKVGASMWVMNTDDFRE